MDAKRKRGHAAAGLGLALLVVLPVAPALRPGGGELGVANHVSHSVSVIDVAPASPRSATRSAGATARSA